jgi:hypothetical protein
MEREMADKESKTNTIIRKLDEKKWKAREKVHKHAWALAAGKITYDPDKFDALLDKFADANDAYTTQLLADAVALQLFGGA